MVDVVFCFMVTMNKAPVKNDIFWKPFKIIKSLELLISYKCFPSQVENKPQIQTPSLRIDAVFLSMVCFHMMFPYILFTMWWDLPPQHMGPRFFAPAGQRSFLITGMRRHWGQHPLHSHWSWVTHPYGKQTTVLGGQQGNDNQSLVQRWVTQPGRGRHWSLALLLYFVVMAPVFPDPAAFHKN